MQKKYTEEELLRAHSFSCNHMPELSRDKKCGCFHCLTIFDPVEIEDWMVNESECDRRGTAACPYCYIDSVIGESSGFPIDENLLRQMSDHFFS